jgi:hypothetical protein
MQAHTVAPTFIQTPSQLFTVNEPNKHGLAHPKNPPSAQIFAGARATHLTSPMKGALLGVWVLSVLALATCGHLQTNIQLQRNAVCPGCSLRNARHKEGTRLLVDNSPLQRNSRPAQHPARKEAVGAEPVDGVTTTEASTPERQLCAQMLRARSRRFLHLGQLHHLTVHYSGMPCAAVAGCTTPGTKGGESGRSLDCL